MNMSSSNLGFMQQPGTYIRERFFKNIFSPFRSKQPERDLPSDKVQPKGIQFDFLSRMKSILKFNCKKKSAKSNKNEFIDFEQADEEFLKSFLNTEDQKQTTQIDKPSFFCNIMNDISFQKIPLEKFPSQKEKKNLQTKNLSLDSRSNNNNGQQRMKNEQKNLLQKNPEFSCKPESKTQEWKRMLDSVWNLDHNMSVQHLKMTKDSKKPTIKLTDLIEKMKKNSQTYNFIRFWSLRVEFLSKTRNHNSKKRKRSTFYVTEKRLAKFISNSNKKPNKTDFSFAEYENSDTQSEKSEKQPVIEERTKVFKIKKINDSFEENIDDNIMRKKKHKLFESENVHMKTIKVVEESDQDSVSSFKRQEVHSLFGSKTEKANEIKDQSGPKNVLSLLNNQEQNISKVQTTPNIFPHTTGNIMQSIFQPTKAENILTNEASASNSQAFLKESDKKEIIPLSIPINQTNSNIFPTEICANKANEKGISLFPFTAKEPEGSLFKLFPVQGKPISDPLIKEDLKKEDSNMQDKSVITPLPTATTEKNINVEKKNEDPLIFQKVEVTTPKTEEKINLPPSLNKEDGKEEKVEVPKVEENPFLTRNFSNTPNLSDFLKSESKNLAFSFGEGSLNGNNNINNMNIASLPQPNNAINNNDMFIESTSPKLFPITPFDSKSSNNIINNSANNNISSPFSFIDGVQNKICLTPTPIHNQNLNATPSLFGNNAGSALFGIGQVNNNNISNSGNGSWGTGLFGNLLNNSNNSSLLSGINNAMSLVSNPSQENSLFANLGGNNLGVLGNFGQNSGTSNSRYNKKRKQRINE